MNKKNVKILSIATVILGILAMTIPMGAMAEPISHRPNQRINATTYGSYNWAGYAVHSGTYTSASGTWIVPTILSGTSGYSSAWVGVGGFSGNSVIQIGTEQDCSAGGSGTGGTDNGAGDTGEKKYHEVDNSNSKAIVDKPNTNARTSSRTSTSCKPGYYAWWEIYPQNAEQMISGFTVNPGDTMTASVSQNQGGSWTLTITDTKTGQSFSTTQTPNFVPDQGSAEVIMERPALCTPYSCKLTNLANFGTIKFNSASSNNGLFDSSADGILMFDSGGRVMANIIPNPIITPGVFSVQWLRNN